MLSEVQCDEAENGKGNRNETSMKGFAIKGFNLSDGLTRGRRREDSGSKSFLEGGCREEILVFKDEVGSVDNFGGEAQDRHLVLCVQIHMGGESGMKSEE